MPCEYVESNWCLSRKTRTMSPRRAGTTRFAVCETKMLAMANPRVARISRPFRMSRYRHPRSTQAAVQTTTAATK